MIFYLRFNAFLKSTFNLKHVELKDESNSLCLSDYYAYVFSVIDCEISTYVKV